MRILDNKIEIAYAELAMNLASEEAIKSKCKKSQRGAIIFNNSRLIGRGYNEPQDLGLCNPCIREKIYDNSQKELCSAVHAEWMAILDAEHRNDLVGSTMYHVKLKNGVIIPSSGNLSCTVCSRIMLKAQIKEFVILADSGFLSFTTEEANKLSFEYFLKKIKAAKN